MSFPLATPENATKFSIWNKIFEFLSPEDNRILRSISKTFNHVASGYAFPVIKFYVHHRDFETIRCFADCPAIARNIQKLVYSIDSMPDPPVSFHEFKLDYLEMLQKIKQFMEGGGGRASSPTSAKRTHSNAGRKLVNMARS